MTAEWQAGFRTLSRQTEPCRGYRGNRREQSYDIMQAFLEEHAEAARCGWSTLELFGVHPEVGVARVEYCGALMVASTKVVEVTRDAIRYANGLVFRRVPVMPAVPVWAFAENKEGRLAATL